MDHARGDDRSCVRRACDSVGSNESLEIDRLARRAGNAESLLKSLPVACIREKESGSLSALLLQSLQDKNAAATIGKRHKRDSRIVLSRTACKG